MLRTARSLVVFAALATSMAVAVVAAGPAQAEPVWRAIETPAGSGGAAKPQLAFDAQGNALLSWRADQPGFGFRQVRYAWRLRNGSIGAAGPISDYGATWHSVALGWNGEAIAAWKMGDESVHASVSPGPGQPFAGEVVLGRPDDQSFFGEPKVVVDDLGNAIVAWMRYGRGSAIPSGAMIATRTEGGQFSAPQELGPAGFGGIIDVATNGLGLAAVAWRGPDNRTHVAIRDPGAASFGEPQSVDLVGPSPQILIDDPGTIVVRNAPGAAAGPMGGGSPAAVTRPAGSTAFGPAGPPPEYGPPVSAAAEMLVSTTFDGRSLATWNLSPEGGGMAVPRPIRFAEQAPGAPWGDTQVPPGAPNGALVTGAISRLGSIGIAWVDEYTASPTQPVHLLVREDPAAVVPTRPKTRSASGTPAPPGGDQAAPGLSLNAKAAARRGAVRLTLSCPGGCRVRAQVHSAGRQLGVLPGRRLGTGEATTLTLRPSKALAHRIRATTRRGRRVVVRVRVLAPGAGPLIRRVVVS